jgi:hypothetical protein
MRSPPHSLPSLRGWTGEFARELLLPIVKWFLAIPHDVVLFFLYIGALAAVMAAWFAILFTGRYPRGIFDYVEGVIRWHNRVGGYAFILVTDRYPPFRLIPDPRGSHTAQVMRRA